MTSSRHPEVHVTLPPTADAWTIIQAVRRGMEAHGLNPGQATSELLHAGKEGTFTVASRLVSVNKQDTAAILAELL